MDEQKKRIVVLLLIALTIIVGLVSFSTISAYFKSRNKSNTTNQKDSSSTSDQNSGQTADGTISQLDQVNDQSRQEYFVNSLLNNAKIKDYVITKNTLIYADLDRKGIYKVDPILSTQESLVSAIQIPTSTTNIFLPPIKYDTYFIYKSNNQYFYYNIEQKKSTPLETGMSYVMLSDESDKLYYIVNRGKQSSSIKASDLNGQHVYEIVKKPFLTQLDLKLGNIFYTDKTSFYKRSLLDSKEQVIKAGVTDPVFSVSDKAAVSILSTSLDNDTKTYFYNNISTTPLESQLQFYTDPKTISWASDKSFYNIKGTTLYNYNFLSLKSSQFNLKLPEGKTIQPDNITLSDTGDIYFKNPLDSLFYIILLNEGD